MLEFTTKIVETEATPQTTLTLPLHLREKSRQRVVLDDGRQAALFLKRGSILCNDDLLISTSQVVVRVKAAAELLSVVRCDDPLLFARACYHLGNRHMPLQIEQGGLSYLHDHVLDEMVRGLGLEVGQVTAPFQPEMGAYDSARHHHHAH